MTVRELYAALAARYPATLSEEWDNDGLMCSADPDRQVRRVLCALDVTEATVEEAIRIRADVILSHHPLIFHPLSAVVPDAAVGRLVIRLLDARISVLSFHTRADAADGGVNDLLCDALGIEAPVPFGEGLGRIGTVGCTTAAEFAARVKAALGAPFVLFGDAARQVLRVAVVGGSGKSEISAAIAAGADTLLSGRLSYETVNEAKGLGINLLEAGHFYTEALLPKHWASVLLPTLSVDAVYFDSCAVGTV